MKTNNFLFMAIFIALMFFACGELESSNDDDGGGNFSSSSGIVFSSSSNYGTLDYGGQTYKTIVIGRQTWMAENLNYNVTGSKCYNNNSTNCNTYGRLYDWATAMNLPSDCNSNSCSNQLKQQHQGICPDGWHIPITVEWNTLINDNGGHTVAGRYLKATNGFAALPGGYGNSSGNFSTVGLMGYWWEAEEYDASLAKLRIMYLDDSDDSNVYSESDAKNNFFSVRCLKNYEFASKGESGTLEYENQTYKTVVIGTQTWMAENLNLDLEGSICYNNDNDNCEIYGRLYDWITAMNLPSELASYCNTNNCSYLLSHPHQGICPSGWHIPSYDDWTTLAISSGASYWAGRYLKSTYGWNNDGNGEDIYDFTALPGGSSNSFYFSGVGDYGWWWTASEVEYRREALGISMPYDYDGFYFLEHYKNYFFSIRCLKD